MSELGATLIRDMIVQAAEGMMPDRDLEIRFVYPVIKEYLGQVYLSDGKVIVCIAPDLSVEKTFDVFLHELGHVQYRHFEDSEDREEILHSLPEGVRKDVASGGRISSSGRILSEKENQQERDADTFALSMGNYAKRRAIDLYGRDDVYFRLVVLSCIYVQKEIENEQ